MIEIREADRTVQAEHTLALAPLGNSVQQSLEHIVIIDKVKPAETSLLDAPGLIGAMVHDTYDTPYDLTVAIGQIYHVFANFECGVALRVERTHLIEEYRRTVVRIALVKVNSELYKSSEFALGCYFFDNNIVLLSRGHSVDVWVSSFLGYGNSCVLSVLN